MRVRGNSQRKADRRDDMIKVEILAVEESRDGGSFESHGSTTYVTEWKCGVKAEGHAKEWGIVRVGGKSQGNPPNGKYVKVGTTICAKERGEHNGMAQYYMDGKATRELNGDGGSQGGGSGGGGSSGGGQSRGGGTPQRSGNYTLADLGCLFAKCHDVAVTVVGDVSDVALQAATATLFIAAKNEGLKVGDKAAAADDDKPDWMVGAPEQQDGPPEVPDFFAPQDDGDSLPF